MCTPCGTVGAVLTGAIGGTSSTLSVGGFGGDPGGVGMGCAVAVTAGSGAGTGSVTLIGFVLAFDFSGFFAV